MEATTLTKIAEPQNRFFYSYVTRERFFQVAASKLDLRTVHGRFALRNVFPSISSSTIKAGTRQRFGWKLAQIFSKKGSSVLVRTADTAALWSWAECQAHCRWLLSASVGRQTFDNVWVGIFENCLDAVKKIVSPFQYSSFQNFVENQDEQAAGWRVRWNGMMLAAIALSLSVLAAPGPVLTVSSLTFSNSARADQLGQLRQAASLLEKAGEGLTKARFDGLQVLEKAVTIVTGTTLVDSQAINREVDSLLHGEKDINEELRNGITSTVQNSWSTVVDVLTNLNPSALSESAGTNLSLFIETTAERVAAFEISALVTLGERWLILTPLLVLPMAWEMKRVEKRAQKEVRERQAKSEELSSQAQLRGEKVRRELERIELRTLLLDAVDSLGTAALQPPRTRGEAGMIRRSINEMLERLEDLKPAEDPMLLVPEFASTSVAKKDEALQNVPTTPTVDGHWRLIYVSEANDGGDAQNFPQFPGVGLDNFCQQVWQVASIGVFTPEQDFSSPSPLRARNTAEIRLGPLGVFQIAVQGSWENLKNGQNALVSFDTFSARPVEILGNKVRDDLPELKFLLPSVLQRSAEWGVAYLDNYLRINRGSRGQMFVFSKIE